MRLAIGRRVLALLLLLIGLVVAIGGGQLALLGGSLYYLIGGIAVAVAGILTWRADRRGPLLYAAFLIVTLLWALWEAGLDGWALAPRLVAPAVLGLFFVVPWFRTAMPKRPALAPVAAGAVSLLVILVVALLPADYGAKAERPTVPVTVAGAAGEWPTWGRTQGGDRFSPLAQITPANVADLKPAWTYHAGTTGSWQKSSFQATPLMIGDSLYLCAPTNILIALDPETGKERWHFDPRADKTGNSQVTACRGVAYYRANNAADCPERIISATFDARLVAVDARTGRPCASFGNNGFVDLKAGLGEVLPGFYYVSSTPTIVRGKIVIGGWVADDQSTDEPSGVIRAYDATTGKFAWAWDIGRPGVTSEPKAGEHYARSTPNSWAPMSGDEQLGLVYVPTGNPTPDHWGGARSAASERFGSSLVALDASTGQPRWAFQTTHHDLWDYDVASQPTLFDMPVGSQSIPAVAQATKRGEIFVFDRRTGRPLLPIVERPAPQRGSVEPDRLSKTQPYSVGMPSFAGARLTERDMWGITPLDQLWCRIEFRKLRYDGPMTPPGTDRSLTYPSIGGGQNWGSVSVDPSRKVMIVNSMYYPAVFELVTRAETDRILDKPGGYSHNFALPQRQAGAPYGVRLTGLISPLDVPCNKPPYGTLSAIDLSTRKLLWSRPFGMARDTGPLGITSNLPLPMGMPNFGGSVTTVSGLTFIGATQDTTFRAFNTSTGKLLWQSRLPAGGQANPMTYVSPRSGRQFVLIVAGGHMLSRSPLGDSVVAFALPEKR
ncbi:membrane-bound PQQ-dependent dehydrogenase, glucose/quinate/shikimate family [Sphingomonas sp.]|uniref:membrane-bound PQQ-dependent dehydrogenase, glucose/quinate/shikimate family n=1 Tax=Sphingomonas sp. TaxID=28214 RepID=UPI00286A4CD2|nr:membrane-bound PQQ-dependent dehydrogenase, glucose/quinate/shikimate family [Sphingomonas sp.]